MHTPQSYNTVDFSQRNTICSEKKGIKYCAVAEDSREEKESTILIEIVITTKR